MDHWKDFAAFLRKHGYEISESVSADKLAVLVTGHGIRMEGWEVHEGFPFPLFADHLECWSRPSVCPMIQMVPTTDEEREQFLKDLRFLSTDEAKEWSDRMGFLDDEKLPRIDYRAA